MTHNLLILEESVLAHMAGDSKIASEFPFLRGMKQAPRKRGGCSSCRRSNNQSATTFNVIKSTIAHMGQDRKIRLKQLLDARQIRIIYQQAGGSRVSYTF